eukprot:7618-Prymnesium_polylepis.1
MAQNAYTDASLPSWFAVQPSWRSLLQRSTRGLESSGFPLPSAGPIPCPTEDGRQRIGLPKPRATTADALAQGASDSFITMPWAGGKPSGYLHSLVVHVDPKHPDPARWSKAMAKGTSAFQLPPNAMSSPGCEHAPPPPPPHFPGSHPLPRARARRIDASTRCRAPFFTSFLAPRSWS